MTLRTAATCMLVAFIIGAYAGYRYAVDRDPLPVASAPATMAAASLEQGSVRAEAPSTVATVAAPAAQGLAIAPVATASAGEPAGRRDPESGAFDPAVLDAVKKMVERSQQLQTVDFPAQMRSEPWANEREAKIRAVLEPQLSNFAGARVLSAECRTTLCRAEVIVPDWATELVQSSDGPGALHSSLGSTGLHVETISTSNHSEQGMTDLVFMMRRDDATPASGTPSSH